MSKNILVITYWDWQDALIQTYTLPYVKIIANILPQHSKIYLVTLNKKKTPVYFEHPKIKVLSFRYIPFGIRAILYYTYVLIQLFFFIIQKKISVIHTWCTPAGVLGYMLSKFSGKALVIDSYEPHAEAMVEVGEWKRNEWAFKILFYFEKQMTHHAKYLIATTEGMIKEYAVSRYNFHPDKNNWFVKPACVNLQLFQPNQDEREQLRTLWQLQDKIIGIYAGKFGGIYLEDEFFIYLKTFQEKLKEKSYFIILSGHSNDYIQQKCKQWNINTHQIMHAFVPHSEVSKYLNIADFAVAPIKPVYTKKFCAPVKTAEYFAMNLYVIISKDISEDSYLIEKYNAGYVMQNWDKEECIKSIEHIQKLLSHHKKESIRAIAIQHKNFESIMYIYQKIYQHYGH